METNKIVYAGKTLIDLSTDTLESSNQLLKGITAHAKDGSVIVGTLDVSDMLSFELDDDGNLYVAYDESNPIPTFEYDESTGDLYTV